MTTMSDLPFPWQQNTRPFNNDAIYWGSRTITWGNLDSYIHSTVRHLKEFGIKAGDRIFISAEADISIVIVLMAFWRARIEVCLFDPLIAPLSVEKAFKEFNARLIVTRYPLNVKCRQVLSNDMVILEPVEQFLGGKTESGAPLEMAASLTVLIRSPGEKSIRLEFLLLDLLKNTVPETNKALLISEPLYNIASLRTLFDFFVSGTTLNIP